MAYYQVRPRRSAPPFAQLVEGSPINIAARLPGGPVERARQLGDAIDTAGDEIEASRRIPAPLLDRLHGARLFRLFLPRSVGGDEVDP